MSTDNNHSIAVVIISIQDSLPIDPKPKVIPIETAKIIKQSYECLSANMPASHNNN